MMTSPCVSLSRAASASSRLAGGVDAFQPVAQQRRQAGVVQAQLVGQARQRVVRAGMAAGGSE
jgi:hypothetical protein